MKLSGFMEGNVYFKIHALKNIFSKKGELTQGALSTKYGSYNELFGKLTYLGHLFCPEELHFPDHREKLMLSIKLRRIKQHVQSPNAA